MIRAAVPFAALLLVGAAWGITTPLSKIAVSGSYRQFGVLFWELLIGATALGLFMAAARRWVPLTPRALWLYLFVALSGTILPGAAMLAAARHLPGGILSILISAVPMLSFPLALALGVDRFSWLRLSGLAFGLGGIVLIAAPETSLPDRAMLAFLPVALLAPLFYAIEGNVMARWGMGGMDPIQLLFGASALGTVIVALLALVTGQWFVLRPSSGEAADRAVIGAALIHVFAYTGYVWLVARAGAVFAAQVAYLVTGFGVIWSMSLLSESYSGWVWAAMGLMFAGLTLVQPRRQSALVPEGHLAKDSLDSA